MASKPLLLAALLTFTTYSLTAAAAATAIRGIMHHFDHHNDHETMRFFPGEENKLTSRLTPAERLVRDVVTLSIEDARSTQAFLHLFSVVPSVRSRRSGTVRDCLEHLTETVHGIARDLARMWDVRSPTILADATSIRDRAGRLMVADATCTAAYMGLDESMRSMLQRRLGLLVSSADESLFLVQKMEGVAQPPNPM